MKIKKLFITIIAIIMAIGSLGLVGCGKEKKDFTITFDANGGSADFATQEINFEEQIKVPNAKRNGYRFCAWVYESGENEYPIKTGDIFSYHSDITVKAVWAEQKAGEEVYTISYDLNYGTVSKGQTYYYRATDEDITLPIPLKPNCYFTGWSGTGIDGLSREVIIKKGSTGDRSYKANYQEVYFTVELVLTCQTYSYEFKEYKEVICTYGGKASHSFIGIGYNTTLNLQNAAPANGDDYSFNRWEFINKNGDRQTFINSGLLGATLFNYDNFSSTSVKIYVVCSPNYSGTY